MASSTLHFKNKIPWQLVRLLAVAFVAWAAGACYSVWLNPEMIFLRHGHVVKRAWEHHLENVYKTKTVVFGGSGCLTAIDPVRMAERHNLPVLNLGFHAGFGAPILTRYALPCLKSGDALIVALESGLLTRPKEIEPLGVQFSFASGRVDALHDFDGIDWIASLLALRPGSENVFTFLGKVILHRPLHRYSSAEIRAGGWQEVAERRAFPTPVSEDLQLSDDAKKLLRFIHAYCAERRVRVAYSLPWSYCPPEKAAEFQHQNLELLSQISEFIPVLNDPRLGAYSVREHFADTFLHLTADGAALKTDELAEQLMGWKTLSREELMQMAGNE